MTSPTPPQEPLQPAGQPPPPGIEDMAAAAAAYLALIAPWLLAVTAAVFPAPGIIDPFGVLSAPVRWAAAIRQWFRTQAGPVLLEPFRRLFGDRGQIIFDQLPFVIEYAGRVQNLLSNVPQETFLKIQQIVTRNAEAGVPVPETAEEIRTTLLDAGATYWTNRAETIARTELRRAHMGGLFGAFIEHGQRTGTAYWKTWLDSDDTRVRPAHINTDGQRRPLFRPFAVGLPGGPMYPAMYPLDPVLPPEMSINCRCDMLIEEEGEDPTRADNRRFREGATP